MALENMTLRRALELAITTEELGAQYYRSLAKRFSDKPEIANVFANLDMDEVAHESEFQSLLKGIADENESVDDVMGDEEAYHVLRAAALFQFFEPGTPTSLDNIENPQDALLEAVNFEKSTLLFYISLKDVVGESPQLSALITAEKRHVATLMRVLISDAEFRGMRDRRSVA